MASARTLQDITDERVVPVDYLGVLILLFLLLVLDRLFLQPGAASWEGPATPAPLQACRCLAVLLHATWHKDESRDLRCGPGGGPIIWQGQIIPA